MQGPGPQHLPAPWSRALLAEGGCGAQAAQGHSGGPKKAARSCCKDAKAGGKIGAGQEEEGGAALFIEI